ncbi:MULTISPECIES: TylF/MycF family methyltransferase [unclassified Nocardioides]|uniref:TylF/MycF family methyltransferase n=1 Tax=unclassified Nocardioides TaxID=2615069 RepID=UPI00360B46F8
MPENPAVDLYLRTMANFLTRFGFESGLAPVELPERSYESYLLQMVSRSMADRQVLLTERVTFDPERRENGEDWPPEAETMVGLKRLRNVRECAESVIADGVPGDFLEAGVWRGGTSIYMRAILAAYGVTDRTVWVADSFRGLPEPDERFPADADSDFHTFPQLAIPLETVQGNFERYGLLDDQVRFLVGWFADTLPTAPVEQLALLRLDGDMYSSTIDTLGAMYDKVSVGGYVLVDDYSIPSCAAAVHDFRDEHGITDPIETVDWTGRFWRKS